MAAQSSSDTAIGIASPETDTSPETESKSAAHALSKSSSHLDAEAASSQPNPPAADDIDDSRFLLVEQLPWEEDIHWGDDDEYGAVSKEPLKKLTESDAILENRSLFPFPNEALESGEWLQDVIWDADQVSNILLESLDFSEAYQIPESARHHPLILDKNDTHMLWEDRVVKPGKKEKELKNPRVGSSCSCCVHLSLPAHWSSPHSRLALEHIHTRSAS